MKNIPRVTVIIPTYARADYLETAIASVFNQTYENVEVIVVDDNGIGTEAQKETEDKIKKYMKYNNFKYIKHETNKNGAAARNTGIKNSTGFYITFLDDDDFFFKKRIEILVNDLEKNENYDAVYSSCVIFENDKLRSIGYAQKKGNLQLDMLKQKSFFRTGSNMFFTAKSLKEIGGFDESFKRHQDLEVFVRFFEKYQIYAEPKILVAKCNRDGMNVPDFQKTLAYRKQYLDTFQNIIYKYKLNEQNDIFHDNYLDLLIKANKTHDRKDVRDVKKEFEKKNIKLTLKDKLRIIAEKVNSNIEIIGIYRKLRNNKYSDDDIKYCYEELKAIKNNENNRVKE